MNPKIYPEKRTSLRVLLAVVGAAALIEALGGWFYTEPSSPAHRETREDPPRAQVTDSTIPLAARAEIPAIVPSAASTDSKQTKRELVDKLSSASNPESKFEAYKLIRNCDRARKEAVLIADRAANGEKPPAHSADEICGDISAGQMAGRLNLLRAAAEAGVHGSASNLADEGPTGYGHSGSVRPDDPEFVAYQQELAKAIDAGAANGD